MNVKKVFCQEGKVLKISRSVASSIYTDFKTVVESFEELESEVTLVLIERKEKLCQRENLNLGFLILSVRNALIDKFFRAKNSRPFTVIFSDMEDEESGKRIELLLEESSLHPVTLLTVKEAVKELKSSLSPLELETLCYFFHSQFHRKEPNPFLREKSQDAKYKAWSRLKPKVRELLKPFEPTEEELRLIAETLMSEFKAKVR
jgi:hypothetical protein